MTSYNSFLLDDLEKLIRKKTWELSKNWIKIKNLTVDVFYFATFLYILFLKLCPTFVVSSLCLLHIYKIWKFSSSTDFESIHSFERSISFNQWWFFKLIVLDDSCEASFKVHLIFFSSQPGKLSNHVNLIMESTPREQKSWPALCQIGWSCRFCS